MIDATINVLIWPSDDILIEGFCMGVGFNSQSYDPNLDHDFNGARETRPAYNISGSENPREDGHFLTNLETIKGFELVPDMIVDKMGGLRVVSSSEGFTKKTRKSKWQHKVLKHFDD